MRKTLRANAETKPLRQKLRHEMTSAEKKMWLALRGEQLGGLKFRRQHGIGPFIVDFFCPEKGLVIEVDGDVHAEENQMARDAERTEYFEALDIKVVRYTNEEVLKNLGGVLEDLVQRLA